MISLMWSKGWPLSDGESSSGIPSINSSRKSLSSPKEWKHNKESLRKDFFAHHLDQGNSKQAEELKLFSILLSPSTVDALQEGTIHMWVQYKIQIYCMDSVHGRLFSMFLAQIYHNHTSQAQSKRQDVILSVSPQAKDKLFQSCCYQNITATNQESQNSRLELPSPRTDAFRVKRSRGLLEIDMALDRRRPADVSLLLAQDVLKMCIALRKLPAKIDSTLFNNLPWVTATWQGEKELPAWAAASSAWVCRDNRQMSTMLNDNIRQM